MRTRLLAAALFFSFNVVPHALAEDDAATAIIKSAMGKGVEVGAQKLAGLLYDTSCKQGNTDPANQYICTILGSVSGRAESEFKEQVKKKLDEISTNIKTIQTGQEQIQKELKSQHEQVLAQFDQVAANVVAVSNMARIEGLWEKYQAQFDKVDADVTRDGMVSFAKDILNNNLHTKVADLNAVLTKDLLNGQPILRFSFYEFRVKQQPGHPLDRFDANKTYDFAEKKFADFRASQHKAFAMYLWAATVMETLCKVKPDQCVALPRSTVDFKADFERYTRQQAEAFNAAVDWLILANMPTRTAANPTGFMSPSQREMILRANIVTASLLMPEEGSKGLWGRVISMGDEWDGSLNVTCGGKQETLKPVFKYTAPIGGPGGFFTGKDDGGPLDWWTSSQANGTYDVVRFSDRWQMYHYSIPDAKPGPCTIAKQLPGKAGVLVWMQPDVKVANLKRADKKTVPFGSFFAMQRAGGVHALVSGGGWKGTMEPKQTQDGSGQREKVVYEWFIDPNPGGGPWVGLLSKGRGEYKVSKGSSRIHNRHVISIRQDKAIRFPEDSTVRLNFFPGQCKGALCNYGENASLLMYDVENNDTESKKGKLDAIVAVYFDPSDRPLTIPPPDSGIVIDRSYGKTGDRKREDVRGVQSAIVKTNPNEGYHLIYYVYFDLETEGRGLDATEYMYRALLAPGSMYLTK